MKKYIPNILTVIRILAITYLNYLAWGIGTNLSTESFIVITVITAIIYFTDFFDGRLARAFQVCSKSGAILDIIADLYYILSQVFILTIFKKIPVCVLYCITAEFIVFIISSGVLSTGKRIPVFNFMGKLTAVVYYAIPYVVTGILFLNLNKMMISLVTNICFILTIAAIYARIRLIIAIPFRNKMSNRMEAIIRWKKDITREI